MTQLHSSRIVSNKRHSQASNSSSETLTQYNEDKQTSILRDTSNNTSAPSHVRHFNIPNDLLDSMEEQRLVNSFEQSWAWAQNVWKWNNYNLYFLSDVSSPQNCPMLFCADTGAPHSWIGDKALERIVRHSGRRSIPIIDFKREIKLGNILVRSRGMVELMLPTPGSSFDIPVILDVLDVEIPPLPELNVLDGNNLLVDNVTNHLRNRIITSKDPFSFEDM